MSHSSSNPGATDKWVNGAIALIVVLFAIATMMGYTQAPSTDHGTDTHAAAEGDKGHGEPTSASEHPEVDEHAPEADEHTEHTDHAADATGEGEAESHGVISEGRSQPHLWAVIPFVLLLGSIAVLPLLAFTEHWWESNKNRFIVAAVLGVITLIYFLFAYGSFEHEIYGAGGFPGRQHPGRRLHRHQR